VPNTPQDVRDQREATAKSAVKRIKGLAMECKKLSDRSVQTFERVTENPELKTLESQRQEDKLLACFTDSVCLSLMASTSTKMASNVQRIVGRSLMTRSE
jgi:predicted short-subunit dehydrogenase-like oxidoreductase (DUF2520 family)